MDEIDPANGMMTLALIALGAYALLTVLFVPGLAFAAGRPSEIVRIPPQK